MRALVQRVKWARVEVGEKVVSAIENGLLVFLGVAVDDAAKDVDYLARKVSALRIFYDDAGRMNLSVKDVRGGALVVSQFTLITDRSSGNRPGFSRAAPAEQARELYERFLERMRDMGVPTQAGIFQADMVVTLANDGPVTILLESR
ncbi:MAG: D-tyrosyl-tRNA(Tyr) deacylase [Deltaproteobacteria bacterium]|nr:D-tyrosyl-tRNA(Tyr) deacylase [Deltaproteobacteria bacterium]